jgi:putative DNA primase/helicase
MRANGITPPDSIIGDGKRHRFNHEEVKGKQSGWYTLHLDGIPAGNFGCWRTLPDGMNWSAKSSSAMTEAERQAHHARVTAMKAQREVEAKAHHAEARAQCERLWESSGECPPDHPYVVQKEILPLGVRVLNETIIVPVMVDNALSSLQFIEPNGAKRMKSGGDATGGYCDIGERLYDATIIVICEGWATGCSLHEATGYRVRMAFNSGNLMAVAKATRKAFPDARIILAADDDYRNTPNTGKTKATAAAKAVGGVMVVPQFGDGRGEKDTDFNDLHQKEGIETVLHQIDSAMDSVAIDAPPAGDVAESALKDDYRNALMEEFMEENLFDGDPTPLPNFLPPVQAFDAALLPESLRGWVKDIAHRMQCPPDFVAVAAVVAASSLIGARAVVFPKTRDDWKVTPNLWGLAVGRPGVKKSPAIQEALNPLNKLEAKERELWQAASDSWEIDNRIAAMRAEANEKEARKVAAKDPDKARALLQTEAKAEKPAARRFVVNDSTVEKLGELLTANPWGTLSYRDEIHGLLCSMDKQGQEEARAFYLQGYDGDKGYTFDRIGRGTSYIPRVCIAMLGGIQPGKLESYVRDAVSGGAGDDGFLQRFGLTVWPDTDRKFVYTDQWPDKSAKEQAWAVFERLAQLQPATDAEPVEWRFSPEAQRHFKEWLTDLENEIRGDDLHPALVSHLSKYRKLIPALALVFALIDTPDSEGKLIQERELLRAMEWGQYLRTHAERMYAAAMTPETNGAKALLSKLKDGKLQSDSFTPREVAQKHWAGLSTPEEVRKAAKVLEDYGWLACQTYSSKGVRPSERYQLHPTLKA